MKVKLINLSKEIARQIRARAISRNDNDIEGTPIKIFDIGNGGDLVEMEIDNV